MNVIFEVFSAFSLLNVFYLFLAVIVCVLLLTGLRYIPNNKVGVVEKLFSFRGSIKRGLIALNGEAGFQPEVLRGGWHLMVPLIYSVHKMPLVTIPQGTIGYVFARDGVSLQPEQTLASNVQAGNFEDVCDFLINGGQKGPQRKILREGTYAINLAQFVVITRDYLYFHDLDRSDERLFKEMAMVIGNRNGFEPIVIKDVDDSVGIITVHDGPSLSEGEIIAPMVGTDPNDRELFHNNFQDPEAFLRAGGRRGRQYQVLVEGTFYLNRLFATVELVAKSVIEVGHVGVVVSYTGTHGADVSGEEYKHGELVKRGERGIWDTPLLPGKYAFNTYAGKIVMVPTTNFILKWRKNESGNHKFDENLTEVALITKDAFEPSLPLSVVVHIDYRKAPLVIQRFGDIKRLVEQTLDPMVSAYFKNVGQTRTIIQLLQERSAIQHIAGEEMKERFAHYNLELEEVLIGTPTSGADGHIDLILDQLRSRQVALEQVETYSRQQKAAEQERELREAEAKAKQQQRLTESEISIQVRSNEGKAEFQRAVQEASQIRTLAEAEAEKVARVGIAQAMATEEQVRAYGGAQYQVLREVTHRFSQAIEQSGVDVVPKVVIGANSSGSAEQKYGGGANILEALIALVLSEKVGINVTSDDTGGKRNTEAEALKKELRSRLSNGVHKGDLPQNISS